MIEVKEKEKENTISLPPLSLMTYILKGIYVMWNQNGDQHARQSMKVC